MLDKSNELLSLGRESDNFKNTRINNMSIYCYICGAKNEKESRFCSNCGTKIVNDYRELEKKAESQGTMCNGIIFTNTEILAAKFNQPQERIRNAINNYCISLTNNSGFSYAVIDASTYLTPQHAWQQHVEFLKKVIDEIGITPYMLTLFIIGGSDIIPMPIINLPDEFDVAKDIDSDVPYAYLISDTIPFEKYANIISRKEFMFVGRLPFAADSTFASLDHYLKMAAENAQGIKLSKGYAIENIARKPVSATVLNPAYRAALFTNISDEKNESRYQYETLYSSLPNHIDATFESLSNMPQTETFDYSANFYYCLLHGDEAPLNSHFFGEYLVKNEKTGTTRAAAYPIALTTTNIGNAENTNIFITSACYGGKFIRYRKKDSMLLSALENKTLIYMGASRTSYSALINKEIMEQDLRLNQRIANVFIDSLLGSERLPCGMAMHKARFETIFPDGNFNGSTALYDALIYNLYGDPQLRCTLSSQKESKFSTAYNKTLLSKQAESLLANDHSFGTEKLSKEESILNKVRGLVDYNLMQIRDRINHYLYSNFNIEPRFLKSIFKVTYSTGQETLRFIYNERKDKILLTHIVHTDIYGNILSIETNN